VRVIAIEEHYSSEPIWQALKGVGRPTHAPDLEGRLLDVGDMRIADMDAAGIDVQVLSLNPPGGQGLDATVAVPLLRDENDRLAEAIGRHPNRLAGFAALPTADPRAAALELERTVREHGFKGTLIHGHTGGRFLDDPFFWPILESAEALDVPVYLHPTRPPDAVAQAYYQGFAPRVSAMLATSAWGWHAENGLHVLRLILAGVFDRFPKLQLVIGHLGEALPFWIRRATGKLPQAITRLPRPLSDYLRTNVQVTTSGIFGIPPFLAALLEVGADRILFAVDYPFSGNEEARAFLDAIPVSTADREKIGHGNAERLLHFGQKGSAM
jgi:predicted TIM-barrel fold metal-dependent hydrolase